MNNQINISVVISAKGIQKVLSKVIRAFATQSLAPTEILIVGDNHAGKPVLELPLAYKKRIKLFKFSGEKNRSRNLGVKMAKGNFAMIIDQDMIPDHDLIEKCVKLLKIYNVIIIPERGNKTASLLGKIFLLEKDFANNEKDSLTPRLFKISLFGKEEMPFDEKFGILDEWGFYINLKRKNPKIGVVDSYLTVIDNSTLSQRLVKNFKKGLVIRNLLSADKTEGLRRSNFVKRGIYFFGKKNYYFKYSLILIILLFLVKVAETISFFVGYMTSLVHRPIVYGKIYEK